MKRSLLLLVAAALVACSVSACHVHERVATVPPGVDCFHTPGEGSGARLANQPLPAGFFAPDSEPFTEEICFRGNPDDPLDTCVRRLDEMEFDGEGRAASRIELIHLDLVSCEPIVVRVAGEETTWDVTSTISGARPSSGRIQVTRKDERGGVFEAELGVLPRMTFKPREPGLEVRVLDMGELQEEPERIATAEPVPWVHSTELELRFDPERGYSPENRFIPGIAREGGDDLPVPFEHRGERWGHRTLTLLLEEPSAEP